MLYNTLLVGTNSGLYAYNGTRWAQHPQIPAVAVVITKDPVDGTIFVTSSTTIYQSTDNGLTFTAITPASGYHGPGKIFKRGGRAYMYATGWLNGYLTYSDNLSNWTTIRNEQYFQQAGVKDTIAISADSQTPGRMGLLDLGTGSEATYTPSSYAIGSAIKGEATYFACQWTYGGSSSVTKTTDLINWSSSPLSFSLPANALVRLYNPGNGKLFASSDLYGAGTGVSMSYLPSATGVDGDTWLGCTLPSNITGLTSSSFIPFWDAARSKYIGFGNGSNQVAESDDGITWTASTSLPAGVLAGTWGNAVLGSADEVQRVSTFGLEGSVSTQDIGGVIRFNGKNFIAEKNAPGISSISNAGLCWTSRTNAVNIDWNAVCYGKGLFVAVANMGSGNEVMTSPDGINWTSRTSAADNNWLSVCYGNGMYVAVSSDGVGNRVMTSPDGIVWTIRASAVDSYWRSVCYGNGLFVAVASSGTGNRVMTSPDGIVWTSRTSVANNWCGVCYGNGLFVAVSNTGTDNRVMTSSDGINWTIGVSAANNAWISVCYGNGLFVAVSNTGTGNRVMTSPNGIDWTTRVNSAEKVWLSVCYGNGLFVAVAGFGTINRVMTSPNGIDWTTRNSSASNTWQSVCYGNGMFVAVSNTGTNNRVMTSGNELTSTFPSRLSDSSMVVVTSGSSIQIPDSCSSFILDFSAASVAITMPPNPVNGQIIRIGIGGSNITSITHSPSVGQSLLVPLTVGPASSFGKWEYSQATATWVRIG